jgi:hypothetical protein
LSKLILPNRALVTPSVTAKLGGMYKLEAVNAENGQRRVLADWFPNLITTAGLEYICNSGRQSYNLDWCQVGTGSTTPQYTDTQLAQRLAGTDLQQTRSGWFSPTEYYAYAQVTYRFTPGQATGNISEVGVGWSSSGNLFSRALVLDEFGAPTTVTVLSNEYLEVTYQVRHYAGTVDQTGQCELDGVTYDWTVRGCDLDNIDNDNSPPPYGWQHLTRYTQGFGLKWNEYYNYVYETDVLASINAFPTGTSDALSNSNGAALGAFLGGTSTTVVYYTNIPLQYGNFATGLGIWLVRAAHAGYQVKFSPKIPKTSYYTLNLRLAITYQERTPL